MTWILGFSWLWSLAKSLGALATLLLNMGYAVAFAGFSLLLLFVVDKVYFRRIDFVEEVKKQNLAVAVVIGSILIAISLLGSSAMGATVFTDRYDSLFQSAARRHFGPGIPWELFKAQGIQESGLDPSVCSGVGACGLMQIMPKTAQGIALDRDQIYFDLMRYSARWSVFNGVFYDRQLWDKWSNGRKPPGEHFKFTLASYNAGFGNILKAQSRAGGSQQWGPVGGQLRGVTGHHANETLGYVRRIEKLFRRLKRDQDLFR